MIRTLSIFIDRFMYDTCKEKNSTCEVLNFMETVCVYHKQSLLHAKMEDRNHYFFMTLLEIIVRGQ